MKIRLLGVLFLLPLFMFGQDVSLNVSQPLENHYGQIYGNDETGYIKIFEEGNDITIYALDKDKMTYVSEKLYKGYMYKTRRHGYKIIGDGIFFFYQKVEGMLTQENLFYSRINTSTAEMGESILIIDTEDFDKNEKYGWYKYQIEYSKDYIYIKSYANEKKINYRVYDNEFNFEFESNFEFDDNIEANINLSYFYDKTKSLLHTVTVYQEKSIEKKVPGKSHYVIFSLEEIKDKYDETDLEFEYEEGLNAAVLNKLKDGRIVLQGISINGMEVSARIYDVFDDLNLVSESVHTLDYHLNMDDKFKDNMKLSSFSYKEIYLPNEDIVSCFNLDANHNYGYPSTFRYYVIAKFTNEGEVSFCNSVVTRGIRNVQYDKFYMGASESKVNFIYMDNLDNLKIKGREYDGNYINAKSLDETGSFLVEKKFKGETYRDYKFSYAFRDGIMQNVNTFSCHVYKKKKEDLVLQIKFED